MLGWVLWEQSGAHSWHSLDDFELRSECVQALSARVGILEAESKRTTDPLISQVYEIAASLGTMNDPRSGVFLVCLPSDTDLRPR